MTVVVQPGEKPAYIRSYVDWGKEYAMKKYEGLEEISPLAHSMVQKTVSTAQTYAPQYVQDKAEVIVSGLESYIESTDAVLVVALDKTQNEFPQLMEKISKALTTEELWALLNNAGGSSTEQLSKYLPSAALQDFEVKNRVQEIVAHVLSQPQLLKEKAANVADNLVEQFDLNQDGKVSVSDLAGSVYDVSQFCADYCQSLLSNVLAPLPTGSDVSNMVKSILQNPAIQPYWSEIEGKVAGMEQYISMFEPLWAAAGIVKMFVSRYALNVKSHLNPLTPYLTTLISETSVTELPFELLQLTSATAGFKEDNNGAKIGEETRALFWALIDISFILEALKESKGAEQTHALEGVTVITDAGKTQTTE